MELPNFKNLSILLAIVFGTVGQASVSITDSLQIGGFFSQGYIRSDGNNYPINSAGGSADFREMAINVNSSVGAHLRLGAQGFAQRFGPYGQDEVMLDWAVADYNLRQEFGVRIGRVKMPKSLYSEALDLDLVRPFIFLPSSIYSPVLRDFSASFNGAMAYGSATVGRGSLDYKVYFGGIPMKSTQGVADYYNNTGLFAMPQGVTALGVDYVAGAALVWNTPVSGLKVGLFLNRLQGLDAQGRFAMAPAALPVAPIEIAGRNNDSKVLAVEYAVAAWTLAGEYQRTTHTVTLRSTLMPPIQAKNGTEAWYLSASRRLNETWEVGAYYAYQRSLYPAANAPASANHSGDFALGVRYDVNEHLTLKLEGHQVDGTLAILNTPRLPNPSGSLKDTTTYWAAKATFSF